MINVSKNYWVISDPHFQHEINKNINIPIKQYRNNICQKLKLIVLIVTKNSLNI
jgi:hypothetical protein